MEAWISDGFAEEEEASVTKGKSVIIHGSCAEIRAAARFMAQVAEHLESANFCHMHLRDCMPGWSIEKHIDIEITVDERVT